MSNTTPVPIADLSKLDISTLPAVTPQAPKPNGLWSSNPVFSYLNDAYNSISEHRKSLGLSNPGTIENLNKEVSRDVFLSQYFFTGLRADLNKAFSMSPAFQTSHTLSIGSQVLPPYAFSALYATDDYFVQGNIDNDFSFSGRVNYGWDKHNISKLTLQLANGQPSMVQLEQDYQASDFSINLKTLNPSLFMESGNAFSGVAVGSLLQSLTKNFAVGLEAMYSKQSGATPPDSAVSYVARYNAGNWIASAQLQAQGALIASYWQRVTDKVEAGLETQVAATMKPITDSLMGTPIGFEPVVEGQTTIGAKYEYRQSVFRGQLDSNGKVGVFMEKRVLPTVSILFSGEIDHSKNASRLGLGLQFESAGNEQLMMMQQGLIDANGNPVPGAPPAL
ncbi:mitochondrial import receptor subunit Tom40p [[Candida] railenensis]|uniref:Translocase of outer membrane 40 kDa subunit n=1 Tax=[Candida] railenensis TaxID=45579 RepID=A0A9P0QS82_9ASCO|nr:mitochondrial import receptor subunit Tom40p [[Candida] railenensis]